MKTKIIILGLLVLFVIGFAQAEAKANHTPEHRRDQQYSHPGPNNSRPHVHWYKKRIGIYPSVYVGKWFDQRWESVRRCIVQRESNGYYGVDNNTSSASGAYQFLISTSDYVARAMNRRDLVGRPASTWTRWEQDKAFYRLWNHGHGRGHWAGGNYSCF